MTWKVVQSNDGQWFTEFGGACTLRGNRPYQQDAFALGLGYAVLADGMGGQPDGDKASWVAIQSAVAVLEDGGVVRDAVLAADEALKLMITPADGSLPYGRNPGYWPATTMIATSREGDYFTVAHLGDSRVYVWRSGVLTQITEDHESFFGSITRYVGGTGHDPDIINVTLMYGDRLIICSDGLFLHLSDEFISRFIDENRDASNMKLADLLCQEAVNAGGMDNVTVVVANA